MENVAAAHLTVSIYTAAVAAIAGLALAASAVSAPPSPGPTPGQPAPANLVDTSWRFLEILGVESLNSVEATLRLNAEGTVTGQTGCNTFIGRYSTTHGGLDFTDLGYTKMACPPAAMKTERDVQAVLNGTAKPNVTSTGELDLFGTDGSLLARLVPMPASPGGAG